MKSPTASGSRGPTPRPLALFDGPRTDFSLARLRHYTGTPPEDFQHFVLFTNYVRYVDEFVRSRSTRLRRPDSRFTALSVPGATYERGDLTDAEAQIAAGQWRRHQMPAYHLMAEGRTGITLVNIGVGPSNAKTICDHVAVLRPEVWLMIGHCGGLRPSQTIGDYVLAHAYLRDDHVLDDVLPPEVPLPAIAEVQKALFDAAIDDHRRGRGQPQAPAAHRHRGHHRRPQLGVALRRVGASLQPEPGGWRSTWNRRRLRRRATASGCPTGPCCASPTSRFTASSSCPGQANAFYERAISQHLRIGIEALGLLQLKARACTAASSAASTSRRFASAA